MINDKCSLARREQSEEVLVDAVDNLGEVLWLVLEVDGVFVDNHDAALVG